MDPSRVFAIRTNLQYFPPFDVSKLDMRAASLFAIKIELAISYKLGKMLDLKAIHLPY